MFFLLFLVSGCVLKERLEKAEKDGNYVRGAFMDRYEFIEIKNYNCISNTSSGGIWCEKK
jgi:hypothetical protein